MPALPLKTVLAYLDDVLEPHQLREISARIAEDEQLRQLVERIQQVVRRRSVNLESDPPADLPDAELIAQYVEGTLDEETANELERRCLESDAILAEVAACHQLVYGGISASRHTIPPQSYQRMYELVAGAAQQAAAARPAAAPEMPASLSPQEQLLLLGLPSVLEGPWPKRLVTLAIMIALFAGLVFSLYFALRRPTAPSEWAQAPTPATPEAPASPSPSEPTVQPTPQPDTLRLNEPQRRELAGWLAWLPGMLGYPSVHPGSLTVALLPDRAWNADQHKPPSEKPQQPIILEPPNLPAGTERLPADCRPRETATLFGPVREPVPGKALLATHAAQGIQETLLWQWSPDGLSAQLVRPQERLSTDTRLQVWPGFRAVLRLDSGVALEMVGNVPELHAEPVLDTSLRLHVPEAPYHLDATLERGWFIITGRKQETLVRLRVAGEVWDLVLPPEGSRVLVSVQWRLQQGIDPPTAQRFLALFTERNGVLWRRTLSKDLQKVAAIPAQARVLLDAPVGAIGGGQVMQGELLVLPLDALPGWASPAAKLPTAFTEALAFFQRQVFQRAVVDNPGRPLDGAKQALLEQLDDPRLVVQRLAVCSLAACDHVEELIRILEARPQRFLRQATREALHYWLGQYPHRANWLRELMVQKLRYERAQANLLVELLRGYKGPDRATAEYLLKIMQDEKSAALRYLAVENLRELYPQLRDSYRPDDSDEARAKAIAAIRKQLP